MSVSRVPGTERGDSIRPRGMPAVDNSAIVNRLEQVPPLRERFLASLGAAGVFGDELDGWALAFTELVNNAVEHGLGRAGDVIAVRWTSDIDHVCVAVVESVDNGLTESDFSDADCADFAETGRGAGLFLIRCWAHEVRVQPTDVGGTEIRIIRRREPGTGRSEL